MSRDSGDVNLQAELPREFGGRTLERRAARAPKTVENHPAGAGELAAQRFGRSIGSKSVGTVGPRIRHKMP